MRHPKTRAERMAHKQQVKAKRRDYSTVATSTAHNHETPAVCSCWMCGNPRKYADSKQSALTLQERRQWIDKLEAMLSLHSDAEALA